ncbi:MAG: hypothetical protein LBQ65_01680, partial [Tannerellaceae bacterium]|nr:hypothetical protein [Tannerellaceae bacterium]
DQASEASARRHPSHPTPFFFPHAPSHVDQASEASARRHPPHPTPFFFPYVPCHVVQASGASAWRHPRSLSGLVWGEGKNERMRVGGRLFFYI